MGYSRRRRPAICRTSSPEPAGPGHTATATDRGVCGAAAADHPPGAVPGRDDRNGRVSRFGHTHSSVYWTPPKSHANLRNDCLWARPTLRVSRSSTLKYARVYLARQHLNPSGPAILHMELELKRIFTDNSARGIRCTTILI